MDDDFKISMDDIKDMVSELFGEKIEKVQAEDAKKILKEEMAEFLSTGIDNVSSSQLTEDEEKLLNDYEVEHGAGSATAAADEPVQRADSVDVGVLKKQIEEETRRKVEEEMREKMKKEMEDEKARKKEELMKKIEQSKKESAEYQASLSSAPAAQPDAAAQRMVLNYSEKIAIINMFDQSQKMLAVLLAKLIKRKPVDTMFLKTLEKAMEKHTDVLRKVDTNQYGKVRTDGSIEVARLAANLNSLGGGEDRKTLKFLKALQDVFEERLIATELAVGIETKDEVMSNLIIQIEQVFKKRSYSSKITGLFTEYVIPSTTIKPGE